MVKAASIIRRYRIHIYKKSGGSNCWHKPWVMSAKHMLDQMIIQYDKSKSAPNHVFLNNQFTGQWGVSEDVRNK
jgi:hypothetical protein